MSITAQYPDIVARLDGFREARPGQFEARCPAHDDHRASLGLTVGDDGRLLLKCLAGCSCDDVCSALGIEKRDLFPPNGNGHANANGNGKASRGKIVATYDYCDEGGTLLYQVCRFDPKDFRQRRPDGAGGWEWSLKGARRVLYRLPELRAADREHPIFIVEGEKDVDALLALGVVATCNVGGAGKWRDEYNESLAGRDVILLPDNDAPGEQHAQTVARALHGKARSVRILRLPRLPPKGDVSDWIRDCGMTNPSDIGYTLWELERTATEWVPASEPDEPTDEPENVTEGAPVEPPENSTRSTGVVAARRGAMFAIAQPENQTEVEAARRFARKHGGKARYCHPWKTWLVWTGKRWESDSGGKVQRLAKAISDEILHEAVESADKSAINYSLKMLSARGISAMLSLAQSEVPVDYHDFDADPWLLNVQNGTLDLRTGKLKPHDRDDLITKIVPVAFNPDADSGVWDGFIASLFDSQDDRDWLRRFIGYCLSGRVSEQSLVIFWGEGSNGKSVFVDAILSALGIDFAMAAGADLLMEARSDRHPTEKADLFGKRLVVASETEANRNLAEATVKVLTGGDRIRARRMKEDFWEFSPTHKIILLTNHKPIVRGTDHAIWRRLRLVPFSKKFWDRDKGETGPLELEADKRLPDKLRDCSEAILAWAVRGCLEWQRNGLGSSDAIQAATATYKSDSDVIGRFVAECCLQHASAKVKASDFAAALAAFCADSGDKTPGTKDNSAWMERNGFERKRNNGSWYLGIGLKYQPDTGTDTTDATDTNSS